MQGAGIKSRPLTLWDYLASFKKSLAALAGIGIAPALLSNFRPNWTAYLFPALGGLNLLARIGTVLLSFLVVCCGYLLTGSAHIRRYIYSGLTVTILSLIAYLVTTSVYVREIAVPSTNTSVLVSVGSQRTEFALREFGSQDDWEMLRERGFQDEEVYRLWTARSVLLGRMLLFSAYLGVVLGWTYTMTSFLALELSSGRPDDSKQCSEGKGLGNETMVSSSPDGG